MKALVKVAKGDGFMEIRDVDEPKIDPSEVLIEVKAAGICGSDIHIYTTSILTGRQWSWATSFRGE
jgi:L-iditol 2-dehydrogenase